MVSCFESQELLNLLYLKHSFYPHEVVAFTLQDNHEKQKYLDRGRVHLSEPFRMSEGRILHFM